MTYITEVLHASHIKSDFSCGKPSLDYYIQKQAGQDMKRKLCVCFVLADNDQVVKGFYTLSNDNLPQDVLPDALKKKLPPSYHHLPVTLLGRLAVDNKSKGQKLGEMLLVDALKRSCDVSRTSVGSMAVVVDPLDEDAVRFYQKYGFILLPGSGKMFLSMKTVEGLYL